MLAWKLCDFSGDLDQECLENPIDQSNVIVFIPAYCPRDYNFDHVTYCGGQKNLPLNAMSIELSQHFREKKAS